MQALSGFRSAMAILSANKPQLRPAAAVAFHRATRTHRQQQQSARSVYTSQMPVDSESPKVNVYTAYTVYKGKGAVSLKVIKPTWSMVQSGSGITVAREGTVLLEFANAVSERKYNWEQKGTFGLSAIECADLLDALESGKERSFFHDPSKGASDEGQVVKTLRLSAAKQEGFFLNLTVQERAAGKEARFSTALSPAEARLIRSLMEYAIPRLIGFNEMFSAAPDLRGDEDPSRLPPPF